MDVVELLYQGKENNPNRRKCEERIIHHKGADNEHKNQNNMLKSL